MPQESIKVFLLDLGNHISFLGTKVLPLWVTSQIWNPVSLLTQLSVIAVHICLCIELLWVGNCIEMVMLCLLNNKTLRFFYALTVFFLVDVNETTQPVVLGDTYQLVWNPAGGVLHHPLSDTVYVKPFESGTILGLKDLQREIMLFPDANGNFAVVDPFRETIPLPPVVVPVYPEENDMILVKGDDDEIWQAQVKRVLFAEKLVKGYFFVKHRNWDENKLWVRESRSSQMDSINFGSILDIATGEWQHGVWKES